MLKITLPKPFSSPDKIRTGIQQKPHKGILSAEIPVRAFSKVPRFKMARVLLKIVTIPVTR